MSSQRVNVEKCARMESAILFCQENVSLISVTCGVFFFVAKGKNFNLQPLCTALAVQHVNKNRASIQTIPFLSLLYFFVIETKLYFLSPKGLSQWNNPLPIFFVAKKKVSGVDVISEMCFCYGRAQCLCISRLTSEWTNKFIQQKSTPFWRYLHSAACTAAS